MNAHPVVEKSLPERVVYFISEHECPRCGRSVIRIPRRFVGLLISKFMLVHRYRCHSMDCDWEGNLREKRNFPPIRWPR
jgi:hypothetical protein